ncbi:transporter substrate-binding domain-containing protein [Roseospira navarrensis]|uniref:Transporter substrate-binding domain-containing protein n=1 Tax=Roseospira navarrensis TaxID=140058 RepID=A0A7X1ZGD4_9PROT|nr:transporter substrate-binding domain-containing protein [Roseospira navarrensis]MQX38036.1 transporter substrate-binding domain-containing protein [Roseospira navarrensis]
MTRMTILCAAAMAVALPWTAAHAQDGSADADPTAAPLECGRTYTTQPGDYLASIAERAYGHASGYHILYQYNPGTLGSPSRLEAGIDLWVPCLGGEGVPEANLPPLAEATSDDIRIVTGADYAPYVDAGLPNGGFSFELVERALQTGNAADYRIDVIKDWGSHLQTLLADGAYDLAFPWFKPDCSQLDRLGADSLWRCENLRFSEPLHEVVITFYGAAGTETALTTYESLKGRTLCRPEGYFTFDLEGEGLTPPAIVRVAGDSPSDCFERLAAGEVDVVTLNADTAESVVRRLGIGDQVSELIDLATVQTLHVVGMRTDPQTRINLLRINKGLIELRRTGVYQDVAARHL